MQFLPLIRPLGVTLNVYYRNNLSSDQWRVAEQLAKEKYPGISYKLVHSQHSVRKVM